MKLDEIYVMEGTAAILLSLESSSLHGYMHIQVVVHVMRYTCTVHVHEQVR